MLQNIDPVTGLTDDTASQPNDFAQMTNTQLRLAIDDWGLKPVRGRDKMLQLLASTNKLVQTSQGNQATSGTDRRAVIYKAITQLIRSNREWYERILSFEPLRLASLRDWLVQAGYQVELYILEEYCDELGICCTNQQ